ncbi:MAG: manganese efflux pump [Planctomycetes bacterium]|nr:manganese efflux pump [Planctomycetota bacterium]
MDTITLLFIAVGLAMDAFAVSVGAGIVLDKITARRTFRLGFHFGLFQFMMPVIGWAAGRSVYTWIAAFDHWIAFALLGYIGARMIREALKPEGEREFIDPTKGWMLVTLSVATSLDALAVGLSLAALNVSIWYPSIIIGIVAATFTSVGMHLGKHVGRAWGRRAEIVGGVILWIIAFRIVIQHLLGREP